MVVSPIKDKSLRFKHSEPKLINSVQALCCCFIYNITPRGPPPGIKIDLGCLLEILQTRVVSKEHSPQEEELSIEPRGCLV
jgi:hypothetical protein